MPQAQDRSRVAARPRTSGRGRAIATEQDIQAQLALLNAHLTRRAKRYRLLDRYYEAEAPPPQAIIAAHVTQAYRRLIPLTDAPWGGLVVDSVRDRLEVSGVRTGKPEDDKRVWEVWQENDMDSESKLAHNATLVAGRAHALVWPGRNGNGPTISLDNAEQMIVQYVEGSRRERVAALRRWYDDDARIPYCTLYRPDGVYKFVGPKYTSGQDGTRWERREVPNEPWPLANPVAPDIPVVEMRVNSRLKPGPFTHARGEFESCLGLIDRINLLTFLGLVVAFWQGFPVRAVIGDRILKDDHGDPIAPFKAMANEVVQFENPNVKLDEFKAADRTNLSVFDELTMFAMATHTPRHYFPYSGGMSNISADAIRADEAGLNAKVVDHKASISDGWEDALALSAKLLDKPVDLPASTELVWKDHESRSMAERADAAAKLINILPWQALAEKILNASQDEIGRWEAMRASTAFNALVAAATEQGGTATVTVRQPIRGASDAVAPDIPPPAGGTAAAETQAPVAGPRPPSQNGAPAG